jgi:hypothetical protein
MYWQTDPKKLPDLLDFFILHGITSNYMQVDSSFELSSDHSPVIATVSHELQYNLGNPTHMGPRHRRITENDGLLEKNSEQNTQFSLCFSGYRIS